MASEQRLEYHWIENRIVKRELLRPAGLSKWRFNSGDKTLIATIEPRDRSFYLREGPSANKDRIVDCVRLYKGVHVEDDIEDFTSNAPPELLNRLRQKINTILTSTMRQWSSFAEETDVTGYLKGRLNGITVEGDGWRINVRSWTYKRNPKEKLMGADLGILFDILAGGKRVVKAAWYQAKMVEQIPQSLEDLPDLSDQVKGMHQRTTESYSLIYTPHKILACRGLDSSDLQSFSDNLVEGAACERGDRTPEVVANTVDVKHVLTFFISDSQHRA